MDTPRDDTCIVFGARSFIGGHICRELLRRGYRVVLHTTSASASASRKPAWFGNLEDVLPHPRVVVVQSRLDDATAIDEVLGMGTCLAYAALPYSKQSLGTGKTRADEMMGLRLFLDRLALSAIQQSVFVSVCGTIGRKSAQPADESLRVDQPKGWSHLAQKVALEDLILDRSAHGLKAVIVNPTMLVGEHDARPSTGEFFAFFAGCPFRIHSTSNINLICVEDAAAGVVMAMERGVSGQRYILSGADATVGALADRLRCLAHRSRALLPMPSWLVRAAAYGSEAVNVVVRRERPLIPLLGIELIESLGRFDNGKARRELGFAPVGDVWQDVDRAFRWYVRRGIISAPGLRPDGRSDELRAASSEDATPRSS